MEIQYFGANCVRLTTRKAQIVVDDNLKSLGLKSITKPTDISLRTSILIPEHKPVKFSTEMPGEYEISGAILHGVGARAHMDEAGALSSVIYTIIGDDVRVAVVGHIYPELSDDQLESIGLVDVAIVPIGGNGYTLDGAGALHVIRKLEPKLVIPTHYADKAIKYEVPQVELGEALKGLGMEPTETTSKLKVKTNELSDTARLVVLERQ